MDTILIALRLILLSILLPLAFSLWFCEAIVAALSRNRRAIVGRAMGAVAIVVWWANVNLALLAAAKRPISRYIFTNHPAIYRRLRAVLVPRRR